jgi:hypothetical protein
VLIHEVWVIDYSLKVEKEHAKRIEKENKRSHSELKILEMRWLKRVKDIKNYVSLIIEISSVELVNYMIKEDIVI